MVIKIFCEKIKDKFLNMVMFTYFFVGYGAAVLESAQGRKNSKSAPEYTLV
jgi:hypothetical protein